jgi:hypothetical protein
LHMGQARISSRSFFNWHSRSFLALAEIHTGPHLPACQSFLKDKRQ